MNWAEALPVIFLALMGVAMLAYVVLDGYDLGVGMLLPRGSAAEKDTMVASTVLSSSPTRATGMFSSELSS